MFLIPNMSVARFAFGPRLKAHRERHGITLQEIAEATKIGASLLSSLERNDVSQWPKGIYRRAFLLSYTRAIDIPFEPVWAEFSHLFPEDGSAPPPGSFADAPQLRLTLETGARPLLPPSTRNVLAAAADLAAVLAVGLATSWMTGVPVWMSLAVTSLIYGASSTALVGGSLALWVLRTLRARYSTRPAEAVVPHEFDQDNDTLDITTPGEAGVLASSALAQRARIFAVPSTRVTGQTHAIERRAADR